MDPTYQTVLEPADVIWTLVAYVIHGVAVAVMVAARHAAGAAAIGYAARDRHVSTVRAARRARATRDACRARRVGLRPSRP